MNNVQGQILEGVALRDVCMGVFKRTLLRLQMVVCKKRRKLEKKMNNNKGTLMRFPNVVSHNLETALALYFSSRDKTYR